MCDGLEGFATPSEIQSHREWVRERALLVANAIAQCLESGHAVHRDLIDELPKLISEL